MVGRRRARRTLLAGFAAALFLLHPAQAEAVAYMAGRSEALSVMFAYAAFAVFLYRRDSGGLLGAWRPPSWRCSAPRCSPRSTRRAARAAAADRLLVEPRLLASRAFAPTGSCTRRWRSGAVAGVALFLELMLHAGHARAGFGMKDFTWYQYLFTQFRALFVYIGIFLLPVHLNGRLGLPVLADAPRSRRHLRTGRAAGADRGWPGAIAGGFRWRPTASSCSCC